MRQLTRRLVFLAALAAIMLMAGQRSGLRAQAQPDSKIALKLAVKMAVWKAGDLIQFELNVTNKTNQALSLDTKPGKFTNTGLDAIASGELFRRVEKLEGKDKLHPPALFNFGGIQPAIVVKEKPLALEPQATRGITIVARVHNDNGKLLLLFDPPDSPGLKTFGANLSRSAYSFPVTDSKLTVRFVYDCGGITAVSNDVALVFEQPK